MDDRVDEELSDYEKESVAISYALAPRELGDAFQHYAHALGRRYDA
jgi:hypothetical protein